MPQISIIVPVYNTEPYLRECLDSLVSQTFADLEIIVVDDGSSDGSLAICAEYARKDPRFRVFSTAHQGVSQARNVGLAHASGAYVAFVDSDDFICPDWCQVLRNLIQEHRLPIAISKEVDHFGGLPPAFRQKADRLLDQEEVLERMFLAEDIRAHVASGLFDRTLFADLSFPDVAVCEDCWVLLELLLRAPGVIRTDRTAYFYRRRQGSLVTAAYSEKDLDCVRVWKRNWDVLVQDHPHLYEQGKTRFIWACYFVLDKACGVGGALRTAPLVRITEYLRKHTLFVLTNRHYTLKRKLSAILLWLSPRLYRSVRNSMDRTGE